MNEKRKIIQITADGDPEATGLYAVADDGTLWMGSWSIRVKGSDKLKFGWTQLEDLPDKE